MYIVRAKRPWLGAPAPALGPTQPTSPTEHQDISRLAPDDTVMAEFYSTEDCEGTLQKEDMPPAFPGTTTSAPAEHGRTKVLTDLYRSFKWLMAESCR